MKIAVAQAACLSTMGLVAAGPSSSRIAGFRAGFKRCWGLGSEIQPTLGTLHTKQGEPGIPRCQASFSRPATGPGGDLGGGMRKLFYIRGSDTVARLKWQIARQRHRVAIGKPVQHLDRGYAGCAFFHAAAFQGLALQDENEVALGIVAQRLLWNH